MWVEKILFFVLLVSVGTENIFDITKVQRNDELCDLQLDYIETNLNQGALWAKIMRDSWGSFPSGIYSGNFYDFGNFDQCIRFHHSSTSHGSFSGQHCTITFPYNLEAQDARGRFAPAPYNPEITIGIGICVPDSCSHKRVEDIANSTLITTRNTQLASFPSVELMCTTEDRNFQWDALKIFVTVLMIIFIALLISSTVYEIYCNQKNLKKKEIFCIFSAYSNSKIIMRMEPFSSNEMVFLHGFRALAIIWIILGHSYILFWLMPVLNNNDFFQWVAKVPTMIFYGGYMAVDTFFLLSAMLMTLSLFRELDKANRINVLALYIRRYIRITAPLLPCVLLAMTFYRYISNGPVWKLYMEYMVTENCEKRWWATLTYLGNFVTPGQYCLIHTWYLMVDMQLYFVSPLILYPLWKLRNNVKVSIAIILGLASLSVIYVYIISAKFDLRISLLSDTTAYHDGLVYYLTFARIDSWMMGILTGFILYKLEGEIVKFSKTFVTFGWTICLLLILTVIFTQFPLQQETYDEIPRIFDTSYDAFKRIAWGLANGWIIIACKFGYAGIVKRFLSLPMWLPISKLSFGLYLVHVMIGFVYMSSIKTPEYFSSLRVSFKFFGDFWMSLIFAFIIALMFEYPALRALKARRRFSRNSNE